MTAGVFVFLGVAAVMVLFGHWGRGHAADLARSEPTAERRSRRERSVRRGGLMWQVAALLPITFGVLELFRITHMLP